MLEVFITMEKTVSDGLWIWGHPENVFNDIFHREPQPPVTPAMGMRDLGAKNIFYVPFGHPMDIEGYSKDTDGLVHAGLSVDRWGVPDINRLEKTMELAKLYPQTDRLVYDDFFCGGPMDHIYTYTVLTVEELIAQREIIHAAGFEMWLVLYQMQLEEEMDIQDYIDVFDGVSFWFWDEPSVEQYQTYSKLFIERTPDKKRLMGCYLYNFGKEKEAQAEMVKYQLDHNLELMKQGLLDGIVLHNNSMGGFDLSAYKAAKEWVGEHGNEKV
jgi:hypothetical protein